MEGFVSIPHLAMLDFYLCLGLVFPILPQGQIYLVSITSLRAMEFCPECWRLRELVAPALAALRLLRQGSGKAGHALGISPSK